MAELPAFKSALNYTIVRDFAYHTAHPLFYGVPSAPEEEPQPEEESLEQPARNRPDDIYRKAVALFDFEPENENEIRLIEGQIVWISFRHGQGWLVAENLESGLTGLVPEEYVQVLPDDESEWEDEPDHSEQPGLSGTSEPRGSDECVSGEAAKRGSGGGNKGFEDGQSLSDPAVSA